MVIETEVWCVADASQEQLGLDGGSEWYPIIIDFRSVSLIKLAGADKFIGDDKAEIMIHGHHMTLNITYKDAVVMFKESRDV